MASIGTIKYKNGLNWIDILHPVGSFYFSTSFTSPSSLFGGSWTQVTGASIRGDTSTGYSDSDTHTLTDSEMPQHVHSTRYCRTNITQNTTGNSFVYLASGVYTDIMECGYSKGNSAAHSILQRSYNCYIWYRAA